MVEEIGHLFDSWADTKRLMHLMNDEFQTLEHQESAESIKITKELARVEQETEHLRAAIKAGLDDMEWANAELRRLKAEREDLASRQEQTAARPEPMRVDASTVEECRGAFGEVLSAGTREEKREYARLFVKRIEVDPDTGDILMYLFGRPPVPVPKQTPASEETGVRIRLVAGARLVADSEQLSTVTAHWRYQGAKHAEREMVRVGAAV